MHNSQIADLAQLFSNQNLQHHLSAAEPHLPGAPRRVDPLPRARLMRDVLYQQGTTVSHAARACAPRRCRMPRSARACAPFMYVRDPPTDAQSSHTGIVRRATERRRRGGWDRGAVLSSKQASNFSFN